MEEKIYKPQEFAKLVGVTVKTLQRWDTTGIWVARRTITNRRFYTHSDYVDYLSKATQKHKAVTPTC